MSAPLPTSHTGLAAADLEDIVREGRRFEQELRGARILVTGATGWFGTWVLDGLLALDDALSLGLSVVAVSRDPEAMRRRHPKIGAARRLAWIGGDIRHVDLDAAGAVTHVVHAAADTGVRGAGTSPNDVFRTIVDGTDRVLRFASTRPGARVLLVSSGAVHGPQRPGIDRIVEDDCGGPDPLDAANAYAEGKRAAEQLAALWHATHGVETVVARCFAFVGPHMSLDAHFAVGNFIRDAIAGGPVRVASDGRARRSYLYMSDLVVWLLAILVDGRPLRPYNVGGHEAVTVASLARRCATSSGRDAAVEIASNGARGRDYVPDVGRATTELGLRVTVPLDEAIARTMTWAASRETRVAA